MVSKFNNFANVRVLHDASGGRGTEDKNNRSPKLE